LATGRERCKDITCELENIPAWDKYLRHEQEALGTVLVNGESTLGPRTARRRRYETTEAAAKIHGSTNEHSSATFNGLFDTAEKMQIRYFNKISAKYFSPFANVSLADCRDVKGTFGTESSNKWKPWNY